MSENPTPMSTPTPDRLRALLLHQLPEDEAQRLEEQLVQDADVAESLRQEETDLVDDYALRRLAAADRAGFEQHLLADPAIRQRVKVARALHEIAAQRAHAALPDNARGTIARSPTAIRADARPAPWNRWPVRAAAVFVVCAFAVAVLMRGGRKEVVAPPLAAEGPAANPTVAAPDVAPDDVADAKSTIVLLADLQRGGQSQPVRVTTGPGNVRLQTETSNSDSSLTYRLSIADDAGRSLFFAEDLHPVVRGGYVFVEVVMPGSTLGAGRRLVTLQPQNPGGEAFSWQLEVKPAR